MRHTNVLQVAFGLLIAGASSIAEANSGDAAVKRAVATYERLAKQSAKLSVRTSPALETCLKEALAAKNSQKAHTCFAEHVPEADDAKQIAADARADDALKECVATGAIKRCQAAGMRAFAVGLEKNKLKPTPKERFVVGVVYAASVPVGIVFTPFTLAIDEVGRAFWAAVGVEISEKPLDYGLTGIMWDAIAEEKDGIAEDLAFAKTHKPVVKSLACKWRKQAEQLDPKGGTLVDRVQYAACSVAK